jgi:dienelactone hydrolase
MLMERHEARMCEIGQVEVLRWVGEAAPGDGVIERHFHLVRDEGVVPGVMWVPEVASGSLPVVLLGHGGSGHKRAGRQVMLGRWFAGQAGIAAVAIDGPFHGERVVEPMSAAEYQNLIAEVGVDRVTDGMIDDWDTTVDALVADGWIDAECLGYLGLSMGTRFGVPLVAGGRVRCAVLGKYGMVQPAAMPAGVDMAPRLAVDAPRVSAPVLFHVQWDDELFTRAGQFELFDLLGSADKHLIAFPGPHRGAVPAAVAAWSDFLLDGLGVNRRMS